MLKKYSKNLHQYQRFLGAKEQECTKPPTKTERFSFSNTRHINVWERLFVDWKSNHPFGSQTLTVFRLHTKVTGGAEPLYHGFG